MIPKIIHYCWFGHNPLPQMAIRCIESWKAFFPNYEIKEWNEDNFDVNIIPYTAEAYQAKKYAFVSDYARFWILYNYGGLYFDTDVEVIRNFDDIIEAGPFMGIENELPQDGITLPDVAPGLGLGAEKGDLIFDEIIQNYKNIHFNNVDGSQNEVTVVKYTTEILKRYGLKNTSGIQKIKGISIYPKEYFCPLDYGIMKLCITDNTRSIHHYSASWKSTTDQYVIEKLRRPSIFPSSIRRHILYCYAYIKYEGPSIAVKEIYKKIKSRNK